MGLIDDQDGQNATIRHFFGQVVGFLKLVRLVTSMTDLYRIGSTPSFFCSIGIAMTISLFPQSNLSCKLASFMAGLLLVSVVDAAPHRTKVDAVLMKEPVQMSILRGGGSAQRPPAEDEVEIPMGDFQIVLEHGQDRYCYPGPDNGDKDSPMISRQDVYRRIKEETGWKDGYLYAFAMCITMTGDGVTDGRTNRHFVFAVRDGHLRYLGFVSPSQDRRLVRNIAILSELINVPPGAEPEVPIMLKESEGQLVGSCRDLASGGEDLHQKPGHVQDPPGPALGRGRP